MRILVIDDDEWIRDSLALLFEAEGCQITAVETAEEGIDEVKQRRYDVIITDLRLPLMNGLTFFRKIKDVWPRAFRILITAYRTPRVTATATGFGVHELLDKPLDGSTVLRTVRALMDRAEQTNIPGGQDATKA